MNILVASVLLLLAEGKKGFSVNLERNPSFVKDGYNAYYSSLLKYGQSLSNVFNSSNRDAFEMFQSENRRIKKMITKRWEEDESMDIDEEGVVALVEIEHGLEYLGHVEIGTPPQRFMMNFDSSSSDTWVFGPRQRKSKQRGFNPNQSSTFNATTKKWAVEYGDGSKSSGYVGFDNLVIGDIKIEHQAVQIATAASAEMVNDAFEGMVGLAYSALNSAGEKTPVENMIEQGLLDEPLWTAKLNKHAPESGGQYTFGFIDENQYTGEITYVNITDDGFWSFPARRRIGKGMVRKETVTIMDTGTTMILTDTKTVANYYARIAESKWAPREGVFIIPCQPEGPDFYYEIGGRWFGVPVADIAYAPVGRGSKFCVGGIQDRTPSVKTDILGDMFMKNYFVVFNVGEKTLGVAGR